MSDGTNVGPRNWGLGGRRSARVGWRVVRVVHWIGTAGVIHTWEHLYMQNLRYILVHAVFAVHTCMHRSHCTCTVRIPPALLDSTRLYTGHTIRYLVPSRTADYSPTRRAVCRRRRYKTAHCLHNPYNPSIPHPPTTRPHYIYIIYTRITTPASRRFLISIADYSIDVPCNTPSLMRPTQP